MKNAILNSILVVSGTFFLLIGTIGIFIPILPTTPFLLLAAVCYAKGSKKFYNWLINNKWFGEYIKNYQEGRGISLTAKIVTITILWITITFSAFIFVSHFLIQIILIIIAILVTIHILTVKTMKRRFGK
jgi:uncharacterized membrane protein YbaN (DUF454 family)